jgi:ribonuclease Z
MLASEFDQVLLTHDHGDHMGGIPFIAGQRHRGDSKSAPLHVFSAKNALDRLGKFCQVTQMNVPSVDQEGAYFADGSPYLRWTAVESDQWITLGPTTRASTFPVDHIPGAVGWKIESNGVSVVFSGDTRLSPSVAEAAQGARLLIHEAFCTDKDQQMANGRGHSTAGEAARIAAQAGVAELVITHIDSPFSADTQPLIDDAKLHYQGPISAANDLTVVTVATP